MGVFDSYANFLETILANDSRLTFVGFESSNSSSYSGTINWTYTCAPTQKI